MRGIFLDSNIFLRHLLNDDPVQSPACREIIRGLEQGTLDGWTSALVISEIVFVLSNPRTYDVARSTIRDRLLPIIDLRGLRLERKRLYPRVFDIFVQLPIDYVDAYHTAHLKHYGQTALYSYDRDFDRIPELQRLEPSNLLA